MDPLRDIAGRSSFSFSSKDPENPRLRNGKYAGPNTRIPRRVRGRYAAHAATRGHAKGADMPRNGRRMAVRGHYAECPRNPRPRTRTRLPSVYAARGYSASLGAGAGTPYTPQAASASDAKKLKRKSQKLRLEL